MFYVDSEQQMRKYMWIYPGNATITKHSRWSTSKDKTNATYNANDAQRKKNCNRGTVLEWSVENYLGGLNMFYSPQSSPLILIQFQITDICSVRIEVFYLICDTLK